MNVELLKALLVEERGHTPENAERLVQSYPEVIIQGIMGGAFMLRPTAMALEMADQEHGQQCSWPRCYSPALCTSGNAGGALVCQTHFTTTNGKTPEELSPDEQATIRSMALTGSASP